MSGVPAGIYGDPIEPGKLRYWDGNSWGQQVPSPEAAGPLGAMQPVSGWGGEPDWVAPEKHNFSSAIRICFSKYAKFSGRASRSEYWYFLLFAVILQSVTNVVSALAASGAMAGEAGVALARLLTLGALLVMFIPFLAVMVRRLHDAGRSGAIVLVLPVLVFIAGPLMVLGGFSGSPAIFGAAVVLIYGALLFPVVVGLLKGTPGPNRYG
jgi:uncharacterized membrane protein YhaH (DUF805 family)